MENKPGKITQENDGFQVVFERVLLHPIARVWNAISNPEELKFWFTDIELDPRPGGKITFQFRDAEKSQSYGEVVSIEPPHRFVWSWETELAVWELTALDEKTTRLVFTYSKISADFAVNVSAGFHSLLDLLQARLEGSEKTYPFGADANDPEGIPLQVKYAAEVYPNYPDILKNPPVVMEKEVNASAERVWKALTDKEQMAKWYFQLDQFQPVTGFQFRFAGEGSKGENYMHICRITAVIPQKKLQYSWQYESYPGYSLVTFELSETTNGTHVKLTHHGLETFPQDIADFRKESFRMGWSELIGKLLPEFVEKG